MTSPAPTLYGKYQLVQLLARGGMAEVFKAKSHGVEGFEKTLVIKRILPEFSQNPSFVEMFVNEAKIAVTLSHANIVQVFDLGRADDTYFIAMEWVAGYDLATLLRRSRGLGMPLPQELAVFIVSEIAKGLDYAHRRRDASMRPLHIVHRDVSPQNVLVSVEGEVKLTDFGVAKAKTFMTDDTEAGVLKGKYAYMSPEQAVGAPDVDATTDLYALGVVLYESLSGVNPFDAPSTYDTLARVRSGAHQPLQLVAPDVPEDLARIVARAMHPSRGERYPNAGGLYEDLVQFLYSSGRRVSGHDLARHVAEVRRASESNLGDREADELRAAFDEGSRARAPTPADVPAGRRSGRHRTGVLRPAHELVDGTLVVVRAAGASGLAKKPETRALLQRFDGRLVEDDRLDRVNEIALVFGLGEPDGRDAEAAARCALRLMLRLAEASVAYGQPTAGIDARRILVSTDGAPVRDDGFASLLEGALELARRAEPGQICVTATVRRALQSRFSTLPLSDDPEGPHLLEAELNPLDAAGKFVGRRDALRRIGEVFALANRGKLQVLALSGEPGSGKTRLLSETRRRLRAGGHDVAFYVVTCQRHGKAVDLSAISDLLRTILGIEELDPPEEVRDKVLRARELGLTMPEVGALGVLLGATDAANETEALGRLIRPAVVRVALKLASERLVAFCFDNAEAMDAESVAILDTLVRESRGARLVLLLAHRPELEPPWRGDSRSTPITIDPLSDDDVARLVATRLAAEEVPVELLGEVTAKSGGNPLYVEEYLKALGDSGAIEVREGHVFVHAEIARSGVPRSLRGLVASRLARLSAADRHLLRIGAVSAGRFTIELLARVLGEPVADVASAVARLEREELLARPTPSELVIAHELVAEVLREGLTLELRREIHAGIAGALEALYPQRIDEIADRLAFHHREAGDRGRAVELLIRAADRAAGEHPRAALGHLEQAIELEATAARRDVDRLLDMYERYGVVALNGRFLVEGAARLKTGIDLAESLGRDADLARLALSRGRILVQAYEVEEGLQWVARAEDVARAISDQSIERDAILARAEAEGRRGDRTTAIQLFDRALALSIATHDRNRELRCLTSLALAHATEGDQRAGLARITEARTILATMPNKSIEAELHTLESLVCFFSKDYDRGIVAATRALELAKEFQLPYHAAVSAHNIGDSYTRVGDFKRAFSSLRYSYDVARENGIEHVQYANLRVLGYIDAIRFASDEGRQHVVDAIAYADRRHAVWESLQGRVMLASIDHAWGALEQAREGLREALRLAVDFGYGPYAEQIHESLAALERGEAIPLIG